MLKRLDERGATAIFVAMSLLVLIGFAALAIDLAVGFNERRQDQTAADVGVMAGAIETLGSSEEIRDLILDFTGRNVVSSYSASDWQAKWEGCVDDELASLNSGGYNFIPVPLPSGWNHPSGRLDCISVDQGGFVRVKLPTLEFSTSFAKVFGFDELQASAGAIARIGNRAGGGILPFGLLSTSTEGEHVCLRDSSGGHAEEPCDGPDAGNFGALESPFYGSQPDGPPKNCNGSPKKDILAVNIARGIDHRVVLDSDGSTSNEVRDTCASMDGGQTPDTLNTFQGISQGLLEGLVSGPVPYGYEPRLQRGSNPKKNVHGYNIDDKPLWDYIDASLTASNPGVDIPAECEAGSFDNSAHPDFDWDGDGTLDLPESWEHLSTCLHIFSSGNGGSHPAPYTTPLFSEGLKESPRFSYVPQFHESTWPSGNGWRHIERFKANWIQATWWKKGGNVDVHHPGEGGTFPAAGNWHLIQLSGIVIPDGALPSELRGNAASGGVDPFKAELYR